MLVEVYDSLLFYLEKLKQRDNYNTQLLGSTIN